MKKNNLIAIIPILILLLSGCGGGGTTNTNNAVKKEETPQKKVEKKEPADDTYHDKEDTDTTPTITLPKDDEKKPIDSIVTPTPNPKPKPNTAPTLTLTGDVNITVTQYKSYVESGFIAQDKEDGNITENVQVNSIDTSTLGKQILNYSVEDSDGLKATASRVVTVVPSEAPLLKILGSSRDTYYLGQPYTEHGYRAWDKEDGGLEVTVDNSDLDMRKIGTYKISYSTVDSDSHSVVKYRTVIVSDSLKITNEDIKELNPDDSGNLNAVFNWTEFIMPRESGEMLIKTYKNGTLTKSFIQTTELLDENTSLLSFSHTKAKASYSLKANTIDIKILHKDDVVYLHKIYTYRQTTALDSNDTGFCFIKEYYNSISIDNITYQDTIMVSCRTKDYSIIRNSYFAKGKGFLLSDENKAVY